MYSASQNKDAKPNRVTDNRPAEFRDDDLAQMEYIAQWHLDNPKGGVFWPLFILCIAGVIGALLITAYIRNDVRKSAKVYYYPADYCMICHGPRNVEPVIKDYRGYKKAHPSPAERRRALKVMGDKHLLQDLIATTGGNP